MRASTILGVALLVVAAGLAVIQRAGAREPGPPTAAALPAPAELPGVGPAPEVLGGKCSFDSDCPYGKCKGGSCGACSFDSDCKGWGKCKAGACGACSFSSECKGFGDCSGGRCTKSPY